MPNKVGMNDDEYHCWVWTTGNARSHLRVIINGNPMFVDSISKRRHENDKNELDGLVKYVGVGKHLQNIFPEMDITGY